MNCEQFQRVLPQIIESGGNDEQEAHLRSCNACSELVRDLKYIAEQAKLLLPLRDPNPRVWNNIQESLAREGLIREGRISLMGPTTATSKKKLDDVRNSARESGSSGVDRASGELSSNHPHISGRNGVGRGSNR